MRHVENALGGNAVDGVTARDIAGGVADMAMRTDMAMIPSKALTKKEEIIFR